MFFKLLFGTALILITTTLHLAAVYFLPQPIGNINVVFVLLLATLMLLQRGWLVWLGFLIFYVLELYTTTTPFGVVLYSGTASMLIGYWLYRGVLANRSWYAGALLGLVTLTLFRIFYLILFLATGIRTSIDVQWAELLVFFLWEIIISTTVLGLIGLLLHALIPSFRARVIHEPRL